MVLVGVKDSVEKTEHMLQYIGMGLDSVSAILNGLSC